MGCEFRTAYDSYDYKVRTPVQTLGLRDWKLGSSYESYCQGKV